MLLNNAGISVAARPKEVTLDDLIEIITKMRTA